jgi:hypothetical protein
MKTYYLANGKKLEITESADMDFTIGDELTIRSYTVKQKGYGRQGLSLQFYEIPGTHYYCDVYPNVKEHFKLEDNEFMSTVDLLNETLKDDTITIYVEIDEEDE